MPIIALFKVSGCTRAKYTAVLKELDQIGVGAAPRGQQYHVAYGSDDNVQVIDVFDTRESLDAFGQALAPLLQRHSITADVEVHDVVNTMK